MRSTSTKCNVSYSFINQIFVTCELKKKKTQDIQGIVNMAVYRASAYKECIDKWTLTNTLAFSHTYTPHTYFLAVKKSDF